MSSTSSSTDSLSLCESACRAGSWGRGGNECTRRRRRIGAALATGMCAVELEVRPGFAFIQLLGAPRGALEVPAGRRRGRPRRWRRVGDALVAGQRAVALEPRLVALVRLLLAKRARLDVLARRQREWRRRRTRRCSSGALAAGHRTVGLHPRAVAIVSLLLAPSGAGSVFARRRWRPRQRWRPGVALAAGPRTVALKPGQVALVGLFLAPMGAANVSTRRRRQRARRRRRQLGRRWVRHDESNVRVQRGWCAAV